MRSYITADTVCVFEHTGTSVDAQKFITSRIRDVAGVDGVSFNNIRIVRWCDPESNQPRRFEHPDGQMYFRYNAQFAITFTIEGKEAEAMQWVLDRLNEGEETSYMNVQSCNVYASPVV